MKRILIPLTAAVLALSLAACGSDSDSNADDSLTVKSGKLTVCSEVPYPPFEYEDADAASGFGGFDIDVVQYIADEMDLELTVIPTEFTAINGASAVNAKQCDLAASAVTINDERKPKMDFSEPYFQTEQSLLVEDGSPIKTIADLKGKNVGVQASTTGEAYANDNAEGADIVAFPSDGKMFQALKAGTVDALLQDVAVNVEHEKAGGFTVVEKYPTEEFYGLSMKKGNTDLVTAVNDALAEMRSSGAYDETYAKYFG